MIHDELGDRIKAMEAAEQPRYLPKDGFIVIRVDGRAFSTFTRGMNRPFDASLSEAMKAAARALIEEFDAPFAYTQSDEITVILPPKEGLSELPFGGRGAKLVSISASTATAAFLAEALRLWPEKCARKLPTFDARAFSAPDAETAADALIWRMRDARRNAVSMAAQSLFSHKHLQHVSVRGMLAMMAEEKGVDFDRDYPEPFRKGTLLRRTVQRKMLDDAEMARIPERYRPTEPVLRTVLVESPVPAEGDVMAELFDAQQVAA